MASTVQPRTGFFNAMLSRIGIGRKKFDTLSNVQPLGLGWFGIDGEGESIGPMTRDEALQIPGVAKAHHTITSKAAQLELVADDGSGVDATDQPTFFTRTDLGEAPEMRMWCTFDDLYFYGSSLWQCYRDGFGQIIGFLWVRRDRWKADTNTGVVTIDGAEVQPSQYLIFNIPMWAGILEQGRRTLTGARDTELAWTSRMRSPASVLDLHVDDDDSISQEEAEEYVRMYRRLHRAGAPAIGMTPKGLTLTVHANSLGSSDLFIQSRDTIRTDIGSHSSLDGSQVDSTGSAGSLTYETQEGQRADFYEFDFPFWTAPVTSRLGLDDVTPAGTKVLVRYSPIAAPDRTATQDQKETERTDPAPAPTEESNA